jgi:hypothetical protein
MRTARTRTDGQLAFGPRHRRTTYQRTRRGLHLSGAVVIIDLAHSALRPRQQETSRRHSAPPQHLGGIDYIPRDASRQTASWQRRARACNNARPDCESDDRSSAIPTAGVPAVFRHNKLAKSATYYQYQINPFKRLVNRSRPDLRALITCCLVKPRSSAIFESSSGNSFHNTAKRSALISRTSAS